LLSAGHGDSVALSALDLTKTVQNNAAPVADRSAGNKPIVIAGQTFSSGFGTRGSSRLDLQLDGSANFFSAQVGMTDDTSDSGPVWFEVIADGKLVLATDPLQKGDAARAVKVDLTGVRHLALAVQGPDQPRPLAAWADARIEYSGAAPVTVALPAEQPYILTPQPDAKPRLTGAAVVGARPGHPLLFTIPATGSAPLKFTAGKLPKGLGLDSATGRITGTAPGTGNYPVQVTVRNSAGKATRELRIVIGDTLALTPPMGWNSWNCFASAVTEADVKSAADAFVKLGLIGHGWTYVNVDDYWETRPLEGDPVVAELNERSLAKGNKQGFKIKPNDDPLLVGPARDDQGRINSNQRFPDMAGLPAYIHSLGLKAGLYSSPGPLTCGQCTASYGHEASDAARFAAWGFDYLKYDWCSYRAYAADKGLDEAKKPYALMGSELRAQSRDIVFSLCQYGDNDVWKWGATVNGNSWRTTGDINDTWGSMSGIGFSQNGHEEYAGPGHWNDPDMLVVGWVGWGRSLHQSHLTPTEQYTHIALWSLLASPLLIGCDLTRVDDFTLNLLTNDEVLAVDQDALGKAAHRVSRQRDLEVWARPLADGSIAVGLFNRGEIDAPVAATWAELNLSGSQRVRDLWRQKDLGKFSDRFSATVPRHGVVLLRLSPN